MVYGRIRRSACVGGIPIAATMLQTPHTSLSCACFFLGFFAMRGGSTQAGSSNKRGVNVSAASRPHELGTPKQCGLCLPQRLPDVLGEISQ